MLTIELIKEAASRIAGHIHRTPVVTSRSFNERAGREVFFKCENLQRAGAFKIRGATNKILSLSDEEKRRGVAAFSSGNHAQAVALASREAGTRAVIAMPDDAPKAKVAATVRLLHMEGIVNYSGHVSARLPDGRGFIIQPYVQSRISLTAEHLLELDFDLNHLPGSPETEMPIETRIHSEILRARPDVQAVVHTHSELAAAFTLADAKLVPMKGHAKRWASGIPIHADPTHIKTKQQGEELAATLGQHNGDILREWLGRSDQEIEELRAAKVLLEGDV